MSNAVFPTLPGLAWSVLKTPQWSTRVQKTVSGREYRAAYYNAPIWKFTLTYEFLRGGSQQELQSLVGFFNARQGAFDSFLYTDPNDNAVTNQQFGIGNGTLTTYQLTRTLGGATEAIQNVNGTPLVFMNANDWNGNYLLSAASRTNLITNSNAFHLSSWTKNDTWLDPYYALAPDGTFTASLMTEDNATTIAHNITNSSVSYVAGTNYTFRCHAKESGVGSKRYFSLVFPTAPFGGTTVGATFDLATGTVKTTVGGAVANIVASANGYYKCAISATPTVSAAGANQIRMNSSSSSVTGTYSGDGVSSFLIFGAHVGLADYRTSYIPSNQTFTGRTGTATYFDVSGTLQTAATGVARSATFDPVSHTSIGLMLEGAATNQVRNNSMTGAVIGTPGTLPNNWFTSMVSGLSAAVSGKSTVNGISYVDIHITGTPAFGGTVSEVYPEIQGVIASANGQVWSSSFFVALVAGSLANVGSFGLSYYEEEDTTFTTNNALGTTFTPTSTFKQYSFTRTINQVNNNFYNSGVGWICSGGAVDFTIRIGMPQIEQSPAPTSVIATTSAAVTRNADTFTTASGTAAADYTIGSTGIVTFNAAPLASSILTWTGSFYYRCRFLKDDQEFENFMQDLWLAKKIEFVSVKL